MQELEIVKQIIKAAGQKSMEFYGTELNIQDKSENNPVTQADFASEEVILNELRRFNYGILSEETDEDGDRLNKHKVWVIDPLDGTKDFIQQTGDFSIMIGLV